MKDEIGIGAIIGNQVEKGICKKIIINSFIL